MGRRWLAPVLVFSYRGERAKICIMFRLVKTWLSVKTFWMERRIAEIAVGVRKGRG